MGIEDHRIAWTRKRLWLPPFYTQSIIDTLTSAVWAAAETAGVTSAEVTNVGMVNFIITDGEFINGYFPCPIDLDPQYPVGWRICYTLDHAGTGAATTSWILLQDTVAEDAAIVLPSTALDTAIPLLDSYGAGATTNFLLAWTDRGIRDTIGLTRSQIEKGAFITFKLEMNAAVNETTVRYIGMEMDYAPMRTVGSGMHLSAPLQSDGKA